MLQFDDKNSNFEVPLSSITKFAVPIDTIVKNWTKNIDSIDSQLNTEYSVNFYKEKFRVNIYIISIRQT